MHSLENPMNHSETDLDPQLWHACAGGMAQIPPLNSYVYYFPQGHAERASEELDFHSFPRISPLVPCRVSSIKYLADAKDEVYAKIGLVPLRECDVTDDEVGLLGIDRNEEKKKLNSFAKTLTPSDANNGGGFSVPVYCARNIFPRLDNKAETPAQKIFVKDVHGVMWEFNHIFRGSPRRHLLTTGWSRFVNQKLLVAGDSVIFFRAEDGDLCVGIRRAKKEEKGNVKVESVIEATSLASRGQPFEVVYYPCASTPDTPDFVVKASLVRAAMKVTWCQGMRFKMSFETKDLSQISWFMGNISSVEVNDPIHWPNSPWKLLQVTWDESVALQNVKRVNPWLVELVSSIPDIHLSSFSQPIKRPRLEFPYGQLPMLMLLGNPFSPSSPSCCSPDSISIGIQGARHAQSVLPSTSDLHINQLQRGFRPIDYGGVELPLFVTSKPVAKSISDVSPHYLKGESSTQKKPNEGKDVAKSPIFILFGQPIFTEEQIAQSSSTVAAGNSFANGNHDNIGSTSNASGSAVIQNYPAEASSEEEFPRFKGHKDKHCKEAMIHLSDWSRD